MKYYKQYSHAPGLFEFFYIQGQDHYWYLRMNVDGKQPDPVVNLIKGKANVKPTDLVDESVIKEAVLKHFPVLQEMLPPWLIPSPTLALAADPSRVCLQCNQPLKANASPLARFCDNKNVCKMAYARKVKREPAAAAATPSKVVPAFSHVILAADKGKWLEISVSWDGTQARVDLVADKVPSRLVCAGQHLKATLIAGIQNVFRHREFSTQHLKAFHLDTVMEMINTYFEWRCPFKSQFAPDDSSAVAKPVEAWNHLAIDFKWFQVIYGQFMNEAQKLSTFLEFRVDPDEGVSMLQKGEKLNLSNYIVLNAQDIERTVMAYISKVFNVRYFLNDSIRTAHRDAVLKHAREHFELNQDPRLKALLRLPSQSKPKETAVIAEPVKQSAIEFTKPQKSAAADHGTKIAKPSQPGAAAEILPDAKPPKVAAARSAGTNAKPSANADRQKFEDLLIDSFIQRNGFDPKQYDYKFNLITSVKGFENEEYFQIGIGNAWNRLVKAGTIIHNNDPGNYQNRLSDQQLAAQRDKLPMAQRILIALNPGPTDLKGIARILGIDLTENGPDWDKAVKLRSALNLLYLKQEIVRDESRSPFAYGFESWFKFNKVPYLKSL